MKKEIELNISTDANRFENWLEQYQHRTLPFLIDLGEGRNLSVIGYLDKTSDDLGRVKFEIKAALLIPHPEKPAEGIYSPEFPVIEFGIFEPREKRINIKAHCLDTRLITYFVTLLDEVARMWPEANEEVLNYKAQMLIVGESLCDLVCRTNPEYIYRLAYNFALSFNQEGGLMSRVEVKKFFSDLSYRVVFNISRFSPFGMIGYIDISPHNDIEARVKVVPYGMLPKFIDQRAEIFEEGITFLKSFAEHLCVTYERGLSGSNLPGLVSNLSQDKPIGRISPKRPAEYDNWVLVWKIIKSWVKMGSSPRQICRDLERKRRELSYKGPVYSIDTIRKIIKAGKAGELETS